MKKVLLGSMGFFMVLSGLFAQQAAVTIPLSDDNSLSSLPRLTLPASYASRPLPSKKDNTRVIYFSGIYSQEVWNCNQASSIWTMFTYEINYLRNLNSSLPENQYSPMAVYNLLNYGNSVQGVSYFDSWNLVKANGIPSNSDFTAYSQNSQVWMTGYDKYYRGMKNRIDEVFALDVGSPEGLLTLKHWINDHLDGSQIGGLANFQIGSGDMVIPTIPLDKGLDEEGQYLIIKYGPYVGHAMTFAGWNDSIRYDVNGDGRYTNTIDINGDGSVNMKDWEIGAMLVVNSWSPGWANAGKVWVMYRLLAESPKDGGIWNNAAMVVRPKKTYEPLLAIKAAIRYNRRNQIKIQVGVSSDKNAVKPERVMDYPCFNYQGDTLPMQGFFGVNADLIEVGLDITPLLNSIPESGQAKIFLEVVQKSSDTKGAGQVESFSVIDYTGGVQEFAYTGGAVNIARNAVSRLAVSVATHVNRPQILTEEIPEAFVGLEYRAQLEADGTTGPYRYADPAHAFIEKPEASSISFTGGTDVFTEPGISARVMDLPFSFPFNGEEYTQVTILADGGIIMGQGLVVYPYVIDTRLRFYQNCGLFPFLSTLYYNDPQNRVTMESGSDAVIIRWNATIDPEGNQPVQFAARIKPGGAISFGYGNLNITPDISWISGLSLGNQLDYLLMDHNFSGVKANSSFSLEHPVWPPWLSLGSNGDLKGTPDKNGVWNLPLKVTDWTGITNHKEITLTVKGGSLVPADQLVPDLQVWPNPVTENVWLEGYSSRAGNITFTVYDLNGRQLVNREYAVFSGRNAIHCAELKDLNPGVYLYRITGVLTAQGKLVKESQ